MFLLFLLKDLIAAGQLWTVTLCRADSDRDNRTNGEELGDPNCEWVDGTNPPQLPIGHPGMLCFIASVFDWP